MTDEGNGRIPVFTVESTCPMVNKPVTLYQDTWNDHIQPRHPETSSRLGDIESTVTTPDYVAKSLPGPGGRNNGNLVLVNNSSTVETSYLHVFLANAGQEWRVTSAIYSKSYHSDKIWDIAASAVGSSYDAESDVLYLYKGEPTAAISEPSTEGLLLRYRVQDHVPCGITVLSYKADWQNYHDLLKRRIIEFLGVEKAAAERALDTAA